MTKRSSFHSGEVSTGVFVHEDGYLHVEHGTGLHPTAVTSLCLLDPCILGRLEGARLLWKLAFHDTLSQWDLWLGSFVLRFLGQFDRAIAPLYTMGWERS